MSAYCWIGDEVLLSTDNVEAVSWDEVLEHNTLHVWYASGDEIEIDGVTREQFKGFANMVTARASCSGPATEQ